MIETNQLIMASALQQAALKHTGTHNHLPARALAMGKPLLQF